MKNVPKIHDKILVLQSSKLSNKKSLKNHGFLIKNLNENHFKPISNSLRKLIKM